MRQLRVSGAFALTFRNGLLVADSVMRLAIIVVILLVHHLFAIYGGVYWPHDTAGVQCWLIVKHKSGGQIKLCGATGKMMSRHTHTPHHIYMCQLQYAW
jgi:hypothetical protein